MGFRDVVEADWDTAGLLDVWHTPRVLGQEAFFPTESTAAAID